MPDPLTPYGNKPMVTPIVNAMTKKTEPVKYQAGEIDAGYHPLGFKIDKAAVPMNRYTQWTIDNDGSWINCKPVCFHSLPADGWIKTEK